MIIQQDDDCRKVLDDRDYFNMAGRRGERIEAVALLSAAVYRSSHGMFPALGDHIDWVDGFCRINEHRVVWD